MFDLHFQLLYQRTPAMLQSIDRHGGLLAASDLWLAKLGYTRDEAIGRPSHAFLTAESELYARDFVRPLLFRTGRCDNIFFQYVAKDGEIFDMQMSAVLEAEADGSPQVALAVIEDVSTRLRAERALADERHRLTNMIAATGVGSIEWHAETGETRVSARWCEMFGWAADEVPLVSVETRRSWIHPDDFARSTSALQLHLSGERDYFEYEARLRHRSGHYFWAKVRGASLTRDREGKPEWVSTAITDISERKLQQEALRKSEEFLERTGNLAGVGGWEIDVATGEVTWTQETYRIIGLPLSHRPFMEEGINRYAPEARPIIRGLVEAAIAGGPAWDVALPLIRADGRRIMVRVFGTSEMANGKPVRLFGAFQDITTRYAEREALSTARERLALATESGRIGVWDWDIRTGALLWDDRMYHLYGMAPRDDVGTYELWSRHLHPEDRAVTEQALRDSVDGIRPYAVEFRVVWDDGSIHHIHGTGRVSRDDDGRPLTMVGANWDVSEERQLQTALNAERGRLATIIEATEIGTWEWNIQSGEFRINPRWAAILGRTLDELEPISIGTNLDLLHPDDRARRLALLDGHLSGVSPHYEMEARMRHRDGHWVWVQSRGKVISRTSDGRPEWMFGKTQDISGRKRQEEELRRISDLLDRTNRLAGVGGWELDPVTSEVTWTAETRRIHGVPADYEPTLASGISFYAPEVRPVIRRMVEKAMQSGGDWDLELPVIRADGQRIIARSVGSVEMAEGRPVRIAGAFQDVTVRVAEREALREASERMTLATDSGRIGIWDWNIAENTMLWDTWTYRLYGLEGSTAIPTYNLWQSCVHPADRDAAEDAIHDAFDGVKPYDIEFRIIWPDSSIHYLHVTGSITRDEAGRPVRLVGSSSDITDARMLAATLANQHELTLNSIGDGVITTDAEGGITWLNPVAERLTGWPASEARGRSSSEIFRIINETTREPAPDPVMLCLKNKATSGLAKNTVLISRHGDEIGIEDSAAPIRDANGQTFGVVLVFHDVTEQRQISGEISYRASHDMLTGLLNRAEFEVRLRFTLHTAHADHSENALLFIDLDQFKLVNDTCGHTAGDQLLQQIAKLLSEIVRASDTLARLGGDEFAIILKNCDLDHAERLAQQICDRLEHFRFSHDAQRFRIGASIGLVSVDQHWSTTAAIVQAADSSCYAAKAAGRNRVHVWRDSDLEMQARQDEGQLATKLSQALDEDRFLLFAQRLQPLRGGVAGKRGGVHAEVLLRMLGPDGAIALPGSFLPAAERFHMASLIDRWVLTRALAWMNTLACLDDIGMLCINVSGQSIGDRAFHRWAMEALSSAGDAICGRLCLEITETAAVTNLTDAAVFISQVREMGVRVALDDFGAGASSFGYLKTMPVDILKIDGQFIRRLMTDKLDEAAVRCFADVASVVGVQTVAEFVDSGEVLGKLRDMGIDFAQGFLIHRPAPIEELV